MSLPAKSVHVRLSDDVHERVRILAQSEDSEIASVCERIIVRAVMGEFHSLTVAAERMARLGLTGTNRD